MTAHRKLIKQRDERARDLGHVPRDVNVPKSGPSLAKINDGLVKRAHAAMLRRIKSG
jgi:hypothetical protein